MRNFIALMRDLREPSNRLSSRQNKSTVIVCPFTSLASRYILNFLKVSTTYEDLAIFPLFICQPHNNPNHSSIISNFRCAMEIFQIAQQQSCYSMLNNRALSRQLYVWSNDQNSVHVIGEMKRLKLLPIHIYLAEDTR